MSNLSCEQLASTVSRISISLSSMSISLSRSLEPFRRKSLEVFALPISRAVRFGKSGLDSKRLGTACRHNQGHSQMCSVSDKIVPRLHPMSCQNDPFFFGHPLQGFSGSHYYCYDWCSTLFAIENIPSSAELCTSNTHQLLSQL